MREGAIPFKRKTHMTFEARSNANLADAPAVAAPALADFSTPADPQAGWASRNPDRAMLFLFVSPRDCGALDELMAL